MKTVLITLVAVVCFLFGDVSCEDRYTTKYDDVDIDAVLRSERLLNVYVNCLLDLGACPPDAAELKRNLPDALAHECAACSEKQKEIANKFTHYLIDHRESDWDLLEEKYDPTGAYRERYLQDQDGQDTVE
ncbi:chemosensory protein 4 [Xylocopa sonorina]|uniref:chemosensory protein 4 n=1 Tax=Xylocopa sonorina TaxID=1818115 RepID=UPI00403B16C8